MFEKGKVAGKEPVIIEMKAGETYAWCSCGMSSTQPWCNGSHRHTGFTPWVIQPEEDTTVAMCTCKQTGNKPYCDGTHKEL